jgi:hypothetical protein
MITGRLALFPGKLSPDGWSACSSRSLKPDAQDRNIKRSAPTHDRREIFQLGFRRHLIIIVIDTDCHLIGYTYPMDSFSRIDPMVALRHD